MCGIFGIVTNKDYPLEKQEFEIYLKDLFLLSKSRGKDASGAAFLYYNKIVIIKDSVPSNIFIKSNLYKNELSEITKKINCERALDECGKAIIGHTRMATNGSSDSNDNNQPVCKNGIVTVHNGIIVNCNNIWEKNNDLKRCFEVDTEIINELIRKEINNRNTVKDSIINSFSKLKGYSSVALMFKDYDLIALYTNNGSLYLYESPVFKFVVFASERYILEQFINHNFNKNEVNIHRIKKIFPKTGIMIYLNRFKVEQFGIDPVKNDFEKPRKIFYKIEEKYSRNKRLEIINSSNNYALIEKNISIIQKSINKLKRCSSCILPETMPFIQFNNEGVCNYCTNYKKLHIEDEELLKKKLICRTNSSNNENCILMFSGGRDSSYALHLLKIKYGMNPIAYSYDWGMITDLARRNQSRLCGELGVEHIIVAADIKRKRENIRKNVNAWLNSPDLGTVPLFMAGDKQFFFHANQLKKRTGINLMILCSNLLEKTDFKWGFCGVSPIVDEHYKLNFSRNLKQVSYYLKNFIKNPSYFNSSLFDTITAFNSYYFVNHDYLNIYQYTKFDEKEVEKVLIDKYNWELAEDTDTTWRIGDGTAPFYNYIYYVMGGFSENDTFRSNQIREGMLDRCTALKLTIRDNYPRIKSIEWYCDTTGVDFNHAIRTINSARKRYKLI